ncbi:phage tail tape measure protein [Fusobacterium nucleatum]|uniref:Phage tail tape measure protein, TP901 family n=1 Tax=Fusobacterium nucleatum TaxID=851 RepID=A0A133PC19_FUSNU|nr:phage tail tape measure protein [Fusobacterium nucleatum]KXA26149.1 phage tail tape measure protein, TP901 family [Fusobacterium nucleatum]MCL4575738.1 phage tail length tape measure protein [Fusobacterium nucleatum YWH7056]MCL4582238.1 phage tail length tape measure protein [Fusobacterium nucleatum YWH7054]
MEHVLSARLELKDKFTTVISKAEKGLAGLYQKAKSMNWEKVNSGLNKFGAVAIGGLAGIGAIAGSSLTAFADLEDQVRRNKAIMGATATEENMLMAQTRELGRSTRFTAQEVAQAQMYQAMAGMKTNEVLEMTPKLLKLSIASGEDLASTSDILTDNLTAFGLKLQDADHFMDVMAATANNTNTSIAGLGEAYKYVASTSRSFESMEEVNIILGTLANNSIKGGQAGRLLGGVYTRLAKATPDMEKAMKKVGISLYDNKGKFKGLRKIVDEMKPVLARMTEEQRNYFLATIAGTEGMRVFSVLLGTTKEDMEKTENAIKNANGSTDKMTEEMSGTTKNKIAEFRSAVDDLKLSIGEGLAPTATDFINKFTSKMAELNSKGTFNTENVEAYFNRIFTLTAEAIKGFAALKVAAMAENIFPGAGKYIAGGYLAYRAGKLAYRAGKAVGDWAGEKIGRTKNKWELRKEYQDKGYTWDEANAQAEKDIETIDLRNSKTEDDEKLNYIKQRMLEEKLRYNKNSGKGIEQLMKETEEDFRERRRIAKLTPEELVKEQTVQKNKTVDSLNKPILLGKPLPEKQKTELEKVSDKLGLKAPTIPNYMLKPSVPESKKSNNDIKVPPQNVTFSPQVNVNMGGVTIRNEADIEKTAEMSKQKIIAELKNYVQITK